MRTILLIVTSGLILSLILNNIMENEIRIKNSFCKYSLHRMPVVTESEENVTMTGIYPEERIVKGDARLCQEFARVFKTEDLQGIKPELIYLFDFGPGTVQDGYNQVLPGVIYTKERGYGLYAESTIVAVDRGGDDALTGDFLSSDRPFYFLVDLPEGNYNVKLFMGDKEGESITTVKAESRRLMLEKVQTGYGEIAARMLTTNVRYNTINNGGEVRLKPREIGHPDWDNQLSIEFSNSHPCICGIEIEKADNVITVYLAGNSTVTDQQFEPWAAWGQMLPVFFKPGFISVANHAESGEALKSFVSEKRLDKIMSMIQPGDYLFIQFGHNDQKPESSAYLEPFTGYKEYLKNYIIEIRNHGAYPVLVTSMHRRTFDDNGIIQNSHGGYPEAMRQTAQEMNVPLIDLHAMSKVLYEALGTENSKKAFVHYPAGSFPEQDQELKDNSHHSNYGAYELAKCVAEGIKASVPELAKYLLDDIQPFDPAHPDPFESWDLPVSPDFRSLKPEGM